ncbi:MAG: hypothetical protein ABMB14_29770 [Myxococcota bacterium]
MNDSLLPLAPGEVSLVLERASAPRPLLVKVLLFALVGPGVVLTLVAVPIVGLLTKSWLFVVALMCGAALMAGNRAIVAAAALLADHGVDGDPIGTLGSVRLGGSPLAGTPMSYDPLYDTLEVDGWVAELPIDEVAAVLAHELVHVRDLRRVAGALGTDPAGWALLHDTLPRGVMRGVTVTAEDRALRVELEVVDVLGVSLPETAAAQRIIADPASSRRDRLRATLAVLQSTGEGTARWVEAIRSLVPVPDGP